MLKRDITADTMRSLLSDATDMPFQVAQLHVYFRSKPLLCLRLKDGATDFVVSFYVNSFACSRGMTMVNCTTRPLFEWIREDRLALLDIGTTKAINGTLICYHTERLEIDCRVSACTLSGSLSSVHKHRKSNGLDCQH